MVHCRECRYFGEVGSYFKASGKSVTYQKRRASEGRNSGVFTGGGLFETEEALGSIGKVVGSMRRKD